MASIGCALFSDGPSENEKAIVESHKQFQQILERQRAQSAIRDQQEKEEPKTVPQLLLEGDRNRAAGRPEQAIYSYYQAYRRDPELPEPIERIAYVHLASDPSRAEALFGSLVTKHPNRASALAGLALAEMSLDKDDLAVEHAERAVAVAPESAQAHAALGMIQDRLGQHEVAQVTLGRAHQLNPRDPAILNNLGVAYLLGGDLERAEHTLRQGILMAPKDKALRNDLGLVLARQGRYEEALEQFRKGGGEQAAQNNLGYAYHLSGRYEDAIRHYEKALLVGGDQQVTVLRNLRAAVASLGPTHPLVDEVDLMPLGAFGSVVVDSSGEGEEATSAGDGDGGAVPLVLPVVREFSLAEERAGDDIEPAEDDDSEAAADPDGEEPEDAPDPAESEPEEDPDSALAAADESAEDDAVDGSDPGEQTAPAPIAAPNPPSPEDPPAAVAP